MRALDCGENSRIFIPREIDGTKGKTIIEAAHRNPLVKVFWHLDEKYIGETTEIHQMALNPAPGKHVLRLVDEQGESVKRRRIRAESGDNLDMFRVYRGDLDRAWERCQRKHKIGNRMLNLIVNVAANYSVTSDKLFYAGACAVRAVEELELAGYSVAVYGAVSISSPSSGGGVVSGLYVYKVKEHNESVDLNTLAEQPVFQAFQLVRIRVWFEYDNHNFLPPPVKKPQPVWLRCDAIVCGVCLPDHPCCAKPNEALPK